MSALLDVRQPSTGAPASYSVRRESSTSHRRGRAEACLPRTEPQPEQHPRDAHRHHRDREPRRTVPFTAGETRRSYGSLLSGSTLLAIRGEPNCCKESTAGARLTGPSIGSDALLARVGPAGIWLGPPTQAIASGGRVP